MFYLLDHPAAVFRRAGAASLLALCSACGGGSSSEPPATAPAITAQPANLIVGAGGAATFSVMASGSGPLSYQWKRNGADIAGAVAPTYTVAATALADTRTRYSVAVRNAAGAVASTEASLHVTGIGIFAGHPEVHGNVDGAANAARFHAPTSVVMDQAGSLLVADTGNLAVRKITPAGLVSTHAPANGLPSTSMAIDAAGNMFFSTGVGVTRLRPDGTRSVLFNIDTSAAGRGYITNIIHGMGTDAAGNLYASNANGIRRVAPDGGYVMLEGSDTGGGFNTGYHGSNGFAYDGKSGMVVTGGTVRRYDMQGNATFIAGGATPSTTDGTGAGAGIANYSEGAVFDAKGNLYFTDTYNGTIRKVTPAGLVTTVAGVAGKYALQTGPLPGVLPNPTGLAIDADGDLYVSAGHAILKIQLPPQ